MSRAPVAAPGWVRALDPRVTRVQVLGIRDGEPHVVRVMPPGRPARVMKRYDRGGAHAARTMRAVARALAPAGLDAPLAVPAVRHWHAGAGVLVQAAVPGRPLLPLLAGRHRRSALVHAARALAALHTSQARLGPATDMGDHVADLIHPHPAVVARAMPALAPRLARLTAALRRWQAAQGPAPAVPLHRDAHPRQMTLEGARVWLVDWDLAARGDAALDVANFALYLRTRLASGGTDAADIFVDAYRAHGVDLGDRVAAHTACMALRLVCKAWRLGHPGWRQRVRGYLALAEQAI